MRLDLASHEFFSLCIGYYMSFALEFIVVMAEREVCMSLVYTRTVAM